MWRSWRPGSVPEAALDGDGRAAGARPRLWKRVVVDILAVYPTLMIILTLSDPWLGGLPRALHVLAVVCLMMPLLIWPVMPMMHRVFARWLDR